ncbi:sporulation peptidase YabG [Oceanobacillus sp. CFH 90083]|uniref:sporulation peptidase YabG n=1 Tax=Oceanobacillus sp. CFH 90083 TaxID=2592336 RepID=UPI00128BB435|nr:sporulation peptidase YabG [Oceanobacillus sp. CFH 90083]
MDIQNGALVTRKSYRHDLLFRVAEIKKGIAILHGEELRLKADADLSDLTIVNQREHKKRKAVDKEKQESSYRLFRQDYQMMKEKRNYEATEGYTDAASYFQLPAKVLHIDGDPSYLRKCIQLYQRIGLQVHGVHLAETEMSFQIKDLLEKIQPDIMVITGHDAYSHNKGLKHDLSAYRHSKYFVEAVREARSIYPNLDQLVIFAGACQSHFESLIRSGANFASSPSRVNIHALDPVYIVAKVAYTSFMESVSVWEALRNTLTGEKGLGGIQTRGLLRTGMPYLSHENEGEI